MQKPEKRRFKPDENLIFHLIESQSSTHATALRELVQNAYDAGATRCELTLTDEGFTASDDGRGFTSKQEIEQFFETFGTPHAENYTEKFGRFRMGRCQIMAFAPTRWESNEFQMDVDFKAKGLDYELLTGQENTPGCRISGQWYKGLHEYERRMIASELRECFTFFYRLPIWLNGERISKSLEELAITAENEDFYVIEDKRWPRLEVYNLGIHVGPLLVDHVRWYLRGMLISKQHLPLDISRTTWLWRNTQQWERLDQLLRKRFPVVAGRGKLTSEQIRRVFYVVQRQETTVFELLKLRLFHDLQRTRYFTLEELSSQDFTFVGPEDDRFLADKLNQWGRVRVLCPDDMRAVFPAATVTESAQLLIEALTKLANRPEEPSSIEDGHRRGRDVMYFVSENFRPFVQAAEGFVGDHRSVAEELLTPQELCALKALRKASERVLNKIQEYAHLQWVDARWRKVGVGLSTTANAWTDGTTFIAINQDLLPLLAQGIRGADFLAALLLHEWCHREANPLEHDAEFYRNFHDLTLFAAGPALLTTLALEINGNYGRYLQQAGLAVPARVLRHLPGLDKEVREMKAAKKQLKADYLALHEQLDALRTHVGVLLTARLEPTRVNADQLTSLLISYPTLREKPLAESIPAWLGPAPDEPGALLQFDVDWTTLRRHENPWFWQHVREVVISARNQRSDDQTPT